MPHEDVLSRTETDSENIVGVIDSEDKNFQVQIMQSRDQDIVKLKHKLEIENVKENVIENGVVFRKN